MAEIKAISESVNLIRSSTRNQEADWPFEAVSGWLQLRADRINSGGQTWLWYFPAAVQQGLPVLDQDQLSCP